MNLNSKKQNNYKDQQQVQAQAQQPRGGLHSGF